MTGILQGLLASIGGAGGGPLYAWGSGGNGRLGDGTVVTKSSPVQIGALTTWSKVAAGYANSASIQTDGTLWAWGRNNSGQLGQNNTISRSSPVQVGSLANWSEISLGGQNAASIKTDGTLWAWGYNSKGQVGDNTTVSKSSPVQIGALTNWSKVSCGYATCLAIKTDGTLWGWGYNDYSAGGLLGDDTRVNKSSPIQVGALTTWSQVSCGAFNAAAVKTDGTLWTWGQNTFGQLGDGTEVARSSPVQVGALTNWLTVACSVYGNFVISVKTDGTLWTWGQNNRGQLGDNTTVYKSSPIQVGALTTWDKIANSSRTAAAIKTDKTLWTWGYDANGQLGYNTAINKSSPIQIGSSSWNTIAGCFRHFVAIED